MDQENRVLINRTAEIITKLEDQLEELRVCYDETNMNKSHEQVQIAVQIANNYCQLEKLKKLYTRLITGRI